MAIRLSVQVWFGPRIAWEGERPTACSASRSSSDKQFCTIGISVPSRSAIKEDRPHTRGALFSILAGEDVRAIHQWKPKTGTPTRMSANPWARIVAAPQTAYPPAAEDERASPTSPHRTNLQADEGYGIKVKTTDGAHGASGLLLLDWHGCRLVPIPAPVRIGQVGDFPGAVLLDESAFIGDWTSHC